MSNNQQWPSHQRQIYKTVSVNNDEVYQSLTDDQKHTYGDMWEIESGIYSDLISSTDYPDELAEVVAKQKTLALILKQEQS